MEPANRKQYVSDSSSFIRQAEYSGGRLIQSKNTPDRMDPVRRNSSEKFSALRRPNDRFVCNRTAKFKCFAHGSESHTQGATAYEEFSVPADSDCPTVAQKKLVHGSSSDADILPSEVTYTAELASSAEKQNFHPNPQVFSLVAWLLSTDHMKVRAFQKTLESYSQHRGESTPRKIMLSDSTCSIAGAVNGRLIPIRPLWQNVQTSYLLYFSRYSVVIFTFSGPLEL